MLDGASDTGTPVRIVVRIPLLVCSFDGHRSHVSHSILERLLLHAQYIQPMI